MYKRQSILFSDGDVMGAVLDRNGLRPSRYYITDDGRLILSSEVGVLDIPQEHVIRKDRLRPGKMLLVDTVKGELVDDEHLKAEYASRQPYGEWLDRNLVNLSDLTVPNRKIPSYTREEMVLSLIHIFTVPSWDWRICIVSSVYSMKLVGSIWPTMPPTSLRP